MTEHTHALLVYLSASSTLTMQQDYFRGGCQPSSANSAARPSSYFSLLLGLGLPFAASATGSPNHATHDSWQAHPLSLPASCLEVVTFTIFFTALLGIGWGLPGSILSGSTFCLPISTAVTLLVVRTFWGDLPTDFQREEENKYSLFMLSRPGLQSHPGLG